MTETFTPGYVSLSYDSFLLACSKSTWQGDEKRCRWCDKQLTGRQQRWCSATCANDAYVQHWWSAASKHARANAERCNRCRLTPAELEPRVRLEAHHIDAALGRHDKCSCIHHDDNVEVLCTRCHLNEHARRRRESERHPHALPLPIDSTEGRLSPDPASHQEVAPSPAPSGSTS